MMALPRTWLLHMVASYCSLAYSHARVKKDFGPVLAKAPQSGPATWQLLARSTSLPFFDSAVASDMTQELCTMYTDTYPETQRQPISALQVP